MVLLKLRHDCLLRLNFISFNEAMDEFCIISEYLDGGNLAGLLRDGDAPGKDGEILPRLPPKVRTVWWHNPTSVWVKGI